MTSKANKIQPKKQAEEPAVSYKELSDQLDAAIAKLQSPDIDVDEAADLYQAALQCIGQLEKHLTTAKNRVSKVQADFSL